MDLVITKYSAKSVHHLFICRVYATKRDELGRIIKRKASVVAQEFTQRPRIYCNEIYAPVVRYDSLYMRRLKRRVR